MRFRNSNLQPGRRLRLAVLFVLLPLLLLSATVPSPISAIHPQTAVSTSPPNHPTAALELLSPTEGVDFEPYLHTVFRSIKRSSSAHVPVSAVKGEKGTAVIRFQILQDGTVPGSSLKIVSSSGKKDMDDGALRVIRTAAPFAQLPRAYPRPFIELQLAFSYNIPRGTAQKP